MRHVDRGGSSLGVWRGDTVDIQSLRGDSGSTAVRVDHDRGVILRTNHVGKLRIQIGKTAHDVACYGTAKQRVIVSEPNSLSGDIGASHGRIKQEILTIGATT